MVGVIQFGMTACGIMILLLEGVSAFALVKSLSAGTRLQISTTSLSSVDTSASNFRPLHQNWWPVVLSSTVDPTRPTAIELLGRKLVLFQSKNNTWTCLDDQCSHRFAPLSEGRVIDNNCIQCSYHGWTFDGAGTCTKVPQQQQSQKGGGKRVTSYPARQDCGMIWVWSDPTTSHLAESIPLPISPLLRRFHNHHGPGAGFMRDLPYGIEFLAENLLDLSHLPYSHHSVGGLVRDYGGPISLRMLSESEKQSNSAWEGATLERDLPLFQAQVVNASEADPIFLSTAKMLGVDSLSEQSNTTIAFYEPSHVEYRRLRPGAGAGHVELFICPTQPGRSRVFLYNCVERLLPPETSPPKPTLRSKLKYLYQPKKAVAAVKSKLIQKLMDPLQVRAHMISHEIFDGDGIFLHKQGNRMRQSGLTYRDYSTPSSADVLLNAYRRYLDAAVQKSGERLSELEELTAAQYPDNEPRSVLLDRYESHTKHCSICQSALQKEQRLQQRFGILQTCLLGSTGASCSAIVALAASPYAIPFALWRTLGLLSVASACGSFWTGHKKEQLAQSMTRFTFRDYIHAESD